MNPGSLAPVSITRTSLQLGHVTLPVARKCIWPRIIYVEALATELASYSVQVFACRARNLSCVRVQPTADVLLRAVLTYRWVAAQGWDKLRHKCFAAFHALPGFHPCFLTSAPGLRKANASAHRHSEPKQHTSHNSGRSHRPEHGSFVGVFNRLCGLAFWMGTAVTFQEDVSVGGFTHHRDTEAPSLTEKTNKLATSPAGTRAGSPALQCWVNRT